MGKFKNLQDDVYSIFGSNAWKAENIKTFPANFTSTNQGNEFIRISVVAGNSSVNLQSVSGLLIIDIFTSAGDGSARTALIADKLDQYLVGKSIKTVEGTLTQFLSSTLQPRGNDAVNPALYRSVYSIPFNYYGVM
jgi:hypothetical protein